MSGQKDILKYAKNKRSFAMMLAHYHQWKNMMKRREFLFPLGRTKAIKDSTVFVVNDSMMDNQLQGFRFLRQKHLSDHSRTSSMISTARL